MPSFPDPVQKLGPDAVVQNLEEPPVAAGVGDPAQNGGAEGLVMVQAEPVDVDDWDVDGGGGGGGSGTGSVRGGLDVAAGYGRAAAVGQGLNSDYGFGPVLDASHHGQGLGIPRLISTYKNPNRIAF